jgi:hypothetical protein
MDGGAFLMSTNRSRLLALAGVLVLAACQRETIDRSMLLPPGTPVSFSNDIRPLFVGTCGGSGCHVGEAGSGVALATYGQLMGSVGAQYGTPIVSPGHPAESPLLDKLGVRPRFGVQMPPGKPPLSVLEIAFIRAWIEQGAPDN